MAADKAAVASGADLGDGLRQRPVAGQATSTPPTPQPEDNKKLVKKVPRLAADELHFNDADYYLGAFVPRNSLSMGGCHCPADLHTFGYLHSTIQDWYQQHCHLG